MNYRIKNIFSFRHIVLIGVLCLFGGIFHAQIKPRQLRNEILQTQNPERKKDLNKIKNKRSRKVSPLPTPQPLAPIVNPLNIPQTTLIKLERSIETRHNDFLNPDLQIVVGNVMFRHDNTLLYCDSAYYYEKANSFDAFGNIKISQGDTLFIYGDFLYYDGNTKTARLRHHVRLENRKTTLTTDSLDYNRIINLAYYFTGGKIVDPENTLTSVWGQYSTVTEDALFRNNVKLVNKNFTLNSDTLEYNSKSKIARIVGKTHIIYQNETDIYSNKGWYNTVAEQMMLLNRSNIIHKDGKTMTGDTIFYDKTKKYGEAFINVILNDTVRRSTLTGDYAYYDEKTETGFATDSALLVDWSSPDTLWVHADTLSTFKDSVYNAAKGIHGVRFFRHDLQGLCDSLVYTARDSIINMYGEPVVWAEENQLSGDFIQAFTKNQKVEKVFIQKNAVAAQKVDSLYFNQLSGKEITAYVDSGDLRRVNVDGNAETIYFPIDEGDSTIVGINKTESSYVTMHLKNKKVQRIVFTTKTTGAMYPLPQVTGGDLYLKNFFWLDKERPITSTDVLLIFPKKTREKIGTSSLMGKGAKSSGDSSSGENKSRGSVNETGSSGSRSTMNTAGSRKALQR
jgi:lipopolysaccharide export system protein LptA